MDQSKNDKDKTLIDDYWRVRAQWNNIEVCTGICGGVLTPTGVAAAVFLLYSPHPPWQAFVAYLAAALWIISVIVHFGVYFGRRSAWW